MRLLSGRGGVVDRRTGGQEDSRTRGVFCVDAD